MVAILEEKEESTVIGSEFRVERHALQVSKFQSVWIRTRNHAWKMSAMLRRTLKHSL